MEQLAQKMEKHHVPPFYIRSNAWLIVGTNASPYCYTFKRCDKCPLYKLKACFRRLTVTDYTIARMRRAWLIDSKKTWDDELKQFLDAMLKTKDEFIKASRR